MQQENLIKNIEYYLEQLPWYVNEYYQSKMAVPYSFKTMYEYLKEFNRFFEWLIIPRKNLQTGQLVAYVNVTKISQIEIQELEHIPKNVMEEFFLFLRSYQINSETGNIEYRKKTMSEVTMRRSRMALSSLFKYLTEQSENDEGEPYFYRNVMKKIESFKTPKQSYKSKAAAIMPSLFLDNETQDFLNFIENSYASKCSPRALTSFNKNKERDLAICALFLASGIRLSELVNIDVTDLNIDDMTVSVIRKGNKLDHVMIADFAKDYLQTYLNIRQSRYNTTKNDTALFITSQTGIPKRLGTPSVERLVAKYSKEFKIRVTPHKLRHTLATRLYDSTKDVLLTADQLGHESTDLVKVYAHVSEQKGRDALNGL